jgi:hypothetical protein
MLICSHEILSWLVHKTMNQVRHRPAGTHLQVHKSLGHIAAYVGTADAQLAVVQVDQGLCSPPIDL